MDIKRSKYECCSGGTRKQKKMRVCERARERKQRGMETVLLWQGLTVNRHSE